MHNTGLPDVLSGQLEHVATVAKRKTGRKPSPQTIWRHCKKGLRGGTIRLQAIFHNGYWQTTDAAFDAFLMAQTDAAMNQQPTSESDDAALKAAGLL
jgi:hypothetical protein